MRGLDQGRVYARAVREKRGETQRLNTDLRRGQKIPRGTFRVENTVEGMRKGITELG